MRDAFIVDALRTPVGRVGGTLKDLPLEALLSPLLRALVRRNTIDTSAIDEVIVGNAAGPGGNPARVALLEAGLPVEIPGLTVDRQCGSGLEAINIGARLIQTGAADLVIAGGAESASTAPLRAYQNDTGSPDFYSRAAFSPEHIGDPDMGIAAENVALKYGISRIEQDKYALQSHAKTILALDRGLFECEMIELKTRSGAVTEDECPRRNTSLAALSSLPPAFKRDGTVTAGNACPVNDGAALVVLSSDSAEAIEHRFGAQKRLKFVDSSVRGVDPNYLGIAPVSAVNHLLSRTSLSKNDLAHVEFNEAFAAQVVASVSALDLDPELINPLGGAIAQGHPYGASGAILVTRLFHHLREGSLGVATLGIGGGLGLASLFSRV